MNIVQQGGISYDDTRAPCHGVQKFYPQGRRGSYQHPLSSFHLPEPEKERGHIAGGKVRRVAT